VTDDLAGQVSPVGHSARWSRHRRFLDEAEGIVQVSSDAAADDGVGASVVVLCLSAVRVAQVMSSLLRR
jgi:hypothetical protein